MSDKALPKGSLVLVTGVNGYIGSHVADKLLGLGYPVRGTARDATKLEAILKALRQRNPDTKVEGLVVEDMQSENAFEEAVKGCAGVVHVASEVSFNPDPNHTVTATTAGLRNALTAASKVPSVKRFVYTSSSVAAVHSIPNKVFHVDSSTWNDEDIKLAWAPPPYDMSRSLSVYSASKAESERMAWDFISKNKVPFIFNTVLPNFNIGPIIDPSSQHGSTAGWTQQAFYGDEEKTQIIQNLPPQYFIDTEDDALIHVAALLEGDVRSERLFAFAEPFNYASLVELFGKIDPGKTEYPAPVNEDRDLSIVANERALELLGRYGRRDFTSLESSVRALLGV